MQLSTECPICDSEQIDSSIDSINGVCKNCGFALHDGIDSAELHWNDITEEHRSRESEDWLTTCSVRNASEQRIARAFDALEENANRLGVGVDARNKAAEIYCDAFRTKITDGRKTACIVAACLRTASYYISKPIPVGRLTESPEIDEKKFYLCQTAIENDLEHDIPPLDPSDCLPFLQTALGLTEHESRCVEGELESVAGEPSFMGKDPAGIAAAGVYVTLNEYTQADVAAAVGLSTETIRCRVNQLRELTNNG